MIWQFVGIFFTSSVKFLFAPIAALKLGFTIWETIIVTGLGGAFGVCFFYYLSERFMQASQARREKALRARKVRRKKKFTRINKTIVKIKQTMGVMGIAYLTLPFISVPLCAIIAAKFFRHKKDTIVHLLTSVAVWAVLLSFLSSLIP